MTKLTIFYYFFFFHFQFFLNFTWTNIFFKFIFFLLFFPPAIIPSRRSMLNWNFNKFWIEHSLVVCSVYFFLCRKWFQRKILFTDFLWAVGWCRCNICERNFLSVYISYMEFSIISHYIFQWNCLENFLQVYNLNKMVIWESKNTGTVFLWQTIYKLFCFHFFKLYLNELKLDFKQSLILI